MSMRMRVGFRFRMWARVVFSVIRVILGVNSQIRCNVVIWQGQGQG